MLNDNSTDMLERLIHEIKPKSIRMVIAVQQFKGESGRLASSPILMIEKTYIETAREERYYDDVTKISDGRAYRKTSYSDGKKSANVVYDPVEISTVTRIDVGHEFMGETRIGYYSAPEPFRYTRVGLIPLQEALPKAEKLGPTEVIGRPCDRFLFATVRGRGSAQSLVYTLDQATSFPLRVAAYKDPDHVREERPSWVWEAQTLDSISGYHFPLKSKYTSYSLKFDGDQETSHVSMTQLIEVKTLEYDVVHPASTFWPKPAPGVMVHDMITNKRTVTPGPVVPKASQTKVTDPIRVDPSAGSWPLWPGVVLSFALLGAALVLWVRAQWR